MSPPTPTPTPELLCVADSLEFQERTFVAERQGRSGPRAPPQHRCPWSLPFPPPLLWRINGLFLFLFPLVSFPPNTPFACLPPAPAPAC